MAALKAAWFIAAAIDSGAQKGDDALRGFAAEMQDRLGAMKRASDVLTRRDQQSSSLHRLIRDEVTPRPTVAKRMAAAHLIETLVPAASPGLQPCAIRGQPRCVLAYAAVRAGDSDAAQRRLKRALAWDGDRLVELAGRPALCVNPVLGTLGATKAPAQDQLGGADATRLEWGTRPGFLPRQVESQCQGGVLYVSRPKSPSLRPRGGWAERRRAPGYNLFWADLEADAQARLDGLMALDDWDRLAPPIATSIPVPRAPIHRID